MRKVVFTILLLLVVAGSFLAGSWSNHRTGSQISPPGARKILYYVDPMHPAYRSDKPGIAPDCGMELVPVYEDGSMGASGNAPVTSGTVTVNIEKQQLVGMRIEEVERTSNARFLRLLGRIAADENRVYRMTTVGDGWVRELSSPTVGSRVEKGQRLATYYAQRFLPAQQAYFYALNTLDRFQAGNKESTDQLTLTRAQVQAAVDSLRALGMDDAQIAEIGRARVASQDIWITAPASGVVLSRSIAPGLRFDRGVELYRIGDLSRVWVLVDVFDGDDVSLRPGAEARVTLPRQRRVFPAKVSDVLPQFDGGSRTLKVRLEADNPDFVLRPDMFVDVELPVKLPPTITVPADAVVDSGVKTIVYVDKGDGVFEPRKVETGWRAGDKVEIVKGLMPGEKIVVSGTFLLDSESRMKAAAAGIYGETSEDPVCGMEVDQGKAKASGRTAEYKGQTYYFCSDECKVSFDKTPTKYAWKSDKGPVTAAGKRLSEVQWEGGKAKEKESAHVGHMHPPAPSAGKSSSR